MIRSMLNNEYKEEFDYIILSRKNLKRSGMRFMVRGIDKNGDVANFVETEEIVVHRKKDEDKINFISYLQIRGSIPLFWTQGPNLELNPTISFDKDNRGNYEAFEKHTLNLTEKYGKTVFINLIDKKNDQLAIGDYLNSLHKEYKDLRRNIKYNI